MGRANFDPHQAQYGPREWIASVLGVSKSWIDKNMFKLIEAGFPKPSGY